MAFMVCSKLTLADQPWDVLVQFGLVGTWSIDCKATSPRLTIFRDESGRARVRVDRDSDSMQQLVVDAMLITSTKLHLVVRQDDPVWGTDSSHTFDITYIKNIKRNDQIRQFESTKSDGKEFVRDGIDVLTGKQTPWTRKCAN